MIMFLSNNYFFFSNFQTFARVKVQVTVALSSIVAGTSVSINSVRSDVKNLSCRLSMSIISGALSRL